MKTSQSKCEKTSAECTTCDISREELAQHAKETCGYAYTNRHIKDEPAFAFAIQQLEELAKRLKAVYCKTCKQHQTKEIG